MMLHDTFKLNMGYDRFFSRNHVALKLKIGRMMLSILTVSPMFAMISAAGL